MLRVLIAEDSELMRRGIKHLLKNYKDILVIGEAVDFSETVQKTSELRPDVVIIDVGLADDAENHDLASVVNGTNVVAISFGDDSTIEDRAKKLGATIFIDKMDLGEKLIPALMRFLPSKSDL